MESFTLCITASPCVTIMLTQHVVYMSCNVTTLTSFGMTISKKLAKYDLRKQGVQAEHWLNPIVRVIHVHLTSLCPIYSIAITNIVKILGILLTRTRTRRTRAKTRFNDMNQMNTYNFCRDNHRIIINTPKVFIQ